MPFLAAKVWLLLCICSHRCSWGFSGSGSW